MNAAASSLLAPTLAAAPGPQTVPGFIAGPEFGLLLDCCTDMADHERTQRMRKTVAGGLDWDRVLRLAQHHRLLPRVYEQLSRLEAVPPEFLESLRVGYQTHARQTLWLTGELIRILNDFASRGIAVLPYKGPALAEILYADVTMRQFGDLDLLVRAADVNGAKAALAELGYRSNVHFTERQQRAHLASGYEYTFDSAHGRNLVELKWQILPRFYSVKFDVDAMFSGAATVRVGGHWLRTLSSEDLLLVLCVHAAKHAWSQLALLSDLVQLAKQPLDWSAIEKKSSELGIRRMVAVNFLLAHRLLAARLPEMVERSMRTDPAVAVLAGSMLGGIAGSRGCEAEATGYLPLMMKLREDWRDGGRILWRLAFTPASADWSAVRLPERFFSCYRVVRLFRLAAKLFAPRRSSHEVA